MWLKFREARNCEIKSLKCVGKFICLSPLEKLICTGRTGILYCGFNLWSPSLLAYPPTLSAGSTAFTCLSMTLFLLSASRVLKKCSALKIGLKNGNFPDKGQVLLPIHSVCIPIILWVSSRSARSVGVLTVEGL